MPDATPSLDTLRKHIHGSDPIAREFAARALVGVDDGEACRILVEALADDEPGVVEAAAETLGLRRSDLCLKAVLPLLDAESDDVRLGAATALAFLEDPEAVSALERHAQDPNAWVQTAVQKALANIGGRAAPHSTAHSEPESPPTPGRRRQLLLDAAMKIGAQSRQKDDGSILMRVPLPDAHHQKLSVLPEEAVGDDPPHVRCLTIIGPDQRDFRDWALKMNARLTRGAICHMRVKTHAALALTECIHDAEITRDFAASTLRRVAKRGNQLAQMLTANYS